MSGFDFGLSALFICSFFVLFVSLRYLLPFLTSKLIPPSDENISIHCAAVLFPDGKEFCGYSHTDCYDKAFLAENKLACTLGIREGFKDSKGNFLDRFDAMVIAKKAGQLRSDSDCDVLASYMINYSKKSSVEN